MANNGNDFLPNYAEHLVPLEEGKYVMPKKLGVIGAGFVLFLLLIVASFTVLEHFPGFIPFFLLGIAFVVWYLWRYVSVEYEYTILQGEMSFDVIYGKRKRKTLYTAKVRNMETIAPLGGERKSLSDFPGVTKERFYASKFKNPNTWYAVVKEENGEKTLLFFEMIDKAEKSLRSYHSSAFRK